MVVPLYNSSHQLVLLLLRNP